MSTRPWYPCVGERVCVRLDEARRCVAVPHYPEEQGRRGTIRALDRGAPDKDHVFLVVFDPPTPEVFIRGLLFKLTVGYYGAHELEACP
jgi:hypothetical protein